MVSVFNWGEDWLYAYNSNIDNWKYTEKNIPEKYLSLVKIANRIQSQDGNSIKENDIEQIKTYIPQLEPSESHKKAAFGVNKTLVTDVEIPKTVF